MELNRPDEFVSGGLTRIVPSGPDAVSETAYARWQNSFDMLLAMLKKSAAKSSEDDGPLGAQWLEFAALTRRGPAGRTLAECAAKNVETLPAEIRVAARSLPGSTWQLYDVLGDAAPGVLLRRIHDDARLVCHGFEGGAGVFQGEVYALRLLDAGRFVASTFPVHIPSPAVTRIAARMEQEYAARASSWSWEEYLRERGSRLLLESIEAHDGRPSGAPVVERDPLTSPSEISVPRSQWQRMARWYRRLAQLRSSSRLHRAELPSGQMADVYGSVTDPVFEIRNPDDRGFLRVWSTDEDAAFPEDAAWLESSGRVILAARQDAERIWHDVTNADIESLVAAMRWFTVHSAIGGAKAA